MPLYYITGVSGSGKSTLRRYLIKLGFPAYDSDELAAFYNRETGEPINPWVKFHERTPEWTKAHQWKVSVDEIASLAQKHASDAAFICGSASNEGDYWDLFTKTFFLKISGSDLKQRVLGRDGNDYGKHPHELKNILDWNEEAPAYFEERGAIIVDAHHPTEKIAKDILKLIDRSV